MNLTLFNSAMTLYFCATLFYCLHLATRRSRTVGWAATAALTAGFLIHTAAFGVRWAESHRLGFGYVPLSNMYESMVFFAWGIAGVYLFFEATRGIRALGAFAAPLAALAMAAVSLNPNTPPDLRPLVPALQSNWLTGHVATCFIGYAAFAVAFAASLAWLVKGEGSAEGGRLPSRRVLEDLSYRAACVGFPFLTIGILTGAVWANQAWGTYWSWDPKETWSLITWLVYAAYLHARLSAAWRGPRLAALSVLGFGCVLFTYWGVNFLLAGLHSYP